MFKWCLKLLCICLKFALSLLFFNLVEKLNTTNCDNHRNASFKYKASCLYEKKGANEIKKYMVYLINDINLI